MSDKRLDDIFLLALAGLGDHDAVVELGRWGANTTQQAIDTLKEARSDFRRLLKVAGNSTPEPWRLGKGYGSIVADAPVTQGPIGADDISAYGGFLIAESASPPNAARIIACVNACAGLSENDIAEAIRQWKAIKRNIVL